MAWGDALLEAQKRDDVRVIVLTGAERAFCSGKDVGRHRLHNRPQTRRAALHQGTNQTRLGSVRLILSYSAVMETGSAGLALAAACTDGRSPTATSDMISTVVENSSSRVYWVSRSCSNNSSIQAGSRTRCNPSYNKRARRRQIPERSDNYDDLTSDNYPSRPAKVVDALHPGPEPRFRSLDIQYGHRSAWPSG